GHGTGQVLRGGLAASCGLNVVLMPGQIARSSARDDRGNQTDTPKNYQFGK
ncbi:Homoserine O-acetyltransferase, partial [Clarias magur]